MNPHTPAEYIQAMRNALETGDFKKAQQLSIQALHHYPDNQDIKKTAHILEPAKATVTKRKDIDRQSLKKSRDWVQQQRRNRNYLNQWVAVRDGELLAAGQNIDQLFDQINDTTNVFFTVIY